jgi:DNA-binding transcriptional LysR family regulator
VDLRQLRYFEAVARHRHFTRAAGELHVAQSALSQAVRRLEAELGVELFERTSRQVRLTAAGETVLARATRVLEEADGLLDAVSALRGLDGATIALGTVPRMGGIDAPTLVTRFRGLHPGVAFDLRTGTRTYILGLLEAGELDVAFVCVSPPDLPAGYVGEELAREPLVAIVPPGHPLAGAAVLPLAELAREPLVTLGPRSAIGQATTVALRAAGGVPSVVTETEEPVTTRALVAQGVGLSLVPAAMAEGPGPVVTAIPTEPAVELPISLVRHAGRRASPAVEAFSAFVHARDRA